MTMKKRMMTQMKKKSHYNQISPDTLRPFFPNFTRNCRKPSFKKYLQKMPHNLKALLPPQIKTNKRKRRSSKTDESDHFIRTKPLRKLGQLQCYYLDKFNQNGVFIRLKQKCKAALQSGPRSKGVAPSRSVLVPGNCSTTA